MNRTVVLSVMVLLNLNLFAQKTLNYYLPSDISYDPSVPTPESVIGHQVGEWLVTHDKLVQYMKAIAESSNRAVLQEYGHTYENRPLLHLIFTSPENHKKINQIKAEHQRLSDPATSGDLDTDDMPVIVLLGYSVHGNESSGANSSLLSAYYLAAAQGDKINNMLENSVIIIDPCLNPDGLTRFTTWANMHKGQIISNDPNNRAFNEVWPGGRTNHYWFDLNRDYVLLTNPESRGKVRELQDWKPNIVTDHHEMGSNSTFFFQPGVPSRNNPLTPDKNYDLTKKIASYHAKALDKIGSLYFSEEVFDDYYFGKGSSYPDINAGVGILFEQASVRGFERESSNGILTFPFAIKNQFTVTLSTLEAAQDLRSELLKYQIEFYNSAFKDADTYYVKAYVFGNIYDHGRTYEFLKILNGHQIEVYHLKDSYSSGHKRFEKNSSYVIPLNQKNYRLIKALFEKVTYFRDTTFYDVSTWNLPLSFNMPYTEVASLKTLSGIKGVLIEQVEFIPGKISGTKDPYAWSFRWDEYYAPRALSEILSAGLTVKVATRKFIYTDDQLSESFGYGTILIPVRNQDLSAGKIKTLMKKVSLRDGIEVYALQTGWTTEGIDLGSGSFSIIKKPEILMLVGNGSSSRDAGEIWHLFDTRYSTPITMIDVNRFNRADLKRYNTIILPGGSLNVIGESGIKSLSDWIQKGGTLIAYKDASRWISSRGLSKVKFKKPVPADSLNIYRYVDKRKISDIQRISGAIFEIDMDLTHPLAYGYHQSIIPVFKTGSTVAELPKNPFSTPLRFTENPLVSGYVSEENKQRIAGSPFVIVEESGRGRIISIQDNTNFRGVWYGTNKIFANAVFFGHVLSSSSRY